VERQIVMNITVHNLAAMSVARVLAVADVSDDEQPWNFALNRPNRPLHNTLVVVRAGGFFVLRFRQPEQNNSADPQPLYLAALLYRLVDRELRLPRHRPDWPPHAL